MRCHNSWSIFTFFSFGSRPSLRPWYNYSRLKSRPNSKRCYVYLLYRMIKVGSVVGLRENHVCSSPCPGVQDVSTSWLKGKFLLCFSVAGGSTEKVALSLPPLSERCNNKKNNSKRLISNHNKKEIRESIVRKKRNVVLSAPKGNSAGFPC